MKFQGLDREERKWRKILKHKRQCDRGESSEIGRFDGEVNPSLAGELRYFKINHIAFMRRISRSHQRSVIWDGQ